MPSILMYYKWVAWSEGLKSPEPRAGVVLWKLNNAVHQNLVYDASQIQCTFQCTETTDWLWLKNHNDMYKIHTSNRNFFYPVSWNSWTGYQKIIWASQLCHILWRVWSWLRTNAGGVLNTCKSNEVDWEACFLRYRVANGWVTRRQPAVKMGTTDRKVC